MKISTLRFYFIQLVMFLLLICQLLVFNGCAEYERWRNGPPEIKTFNVPREVRYGETVVFRAGVSDPEEDDLTYLWDVSDGTLNREMEPEVEWTAPELRDAIAPDQSVTVHLSVKDGGEEDVSQSTSVTVFSKSYRVAESLSGVYELVRAQVAGKSVEELGSMRLTTTTFTREFQGSDKFLFGSYKLIEPFDEKKGTIYWFSDESPDPIVSTYTWDGELLVIFHAATSTGHVYQKRN